MSLEGLRLQYDALGQLILPSTQSSSHVVTLRYELPPPAMGLAGTAFSRTAARDTPTDLDSFALENLRVWADMTGG